MPDAEPGKRFNETLPPDCGSMSVTFRSRLQDRSFSGRAVLDSECRRPGACTRWPISWVLMPAFQVVCTTASSQIYLCR